MGYKKMVLVGVDLYDQRYFWLPYDRTRRECEEKDISVDDIYPGIKWTIEYFRFIKPFLDERGVSVEIYNPKSLLHEVFPIFDKAVINGARDQKPKEELKDATCQDRQASIIG
ncbi:MAG: hypothetical protein LHV69_00740 [Elusimicrobia bacterium]|nr:hypothetical protein [Candidatus Obscuribacterium magneticum]